MVKQNHTVENLARFLLGTIHTYLSERNRSELLTTVTELIAMAKAAYIGVS
jgi:hypothetical protein